MKVLIFLGIIVILASCRESVLQQVSSTIDQVKEKARQIHNKFDADGDGSVSFEEFKQGVKNGLGFGDDDLSLPYADKIYRKYLFPQNEKQRKAFSEEDFEEIFRDYKQEKQQQGKELLNDIKQKKDSLIKETKKKANEIYDKFDQDKDGHVSFDELKKGLNNKIFGDKGSQDGKSLNEYANQLYEKYVKQDKKDGLHFTKEDFYSIFKDQHDKSLLEKAKEKAHKIHKDLDANGDGQVSLEEIQKGVAQGFGFDDEKNDDSAIKQKASALYEKYIKPRGEDLWFKLEDIGEIIADKLKEGKQLASEKWQQGKEIVGEKLQKGKEMAQQKWQESKQVISEKLSEGKQVLSQKFDQGKQIISDKLQEGKQFAKEKWQQGKFSEKLQKGKQIIGEKLQEGIQIAKDKLSQGIQIIGENLSQGKQMAKEKWQQGKQIIGEKLLQGKEILEDKLEKGKEIIGEKLSQGKQIIGEKLSQGKEILEDKLEKGKEIIGEKLSQGKEILGDKFEKGREIIGEKLLQGKQIIEQKLEEGKQAGSQKVEQLKESISEKLEEGSQLFEDLKVKANEIYDKVDSNHDNSISLEELKQNLKHIFGFEEQNAKDQGLMTCIKQLYERHLNADWKDQWELTKDDLVKLIYQWKRQCPAEKPGVEIRQKEL